MPSVSCERNYSASHLSSPRRVMRMEMFNYVILSYRSQVSSNLWTTMECLSRLLAVYK